MQKSRRTLLVLSLFPLVCFFLCHNYAQAFSESAPFSCPYAPAHWPIWRLSVALLSVSWMLFLLRQRATQIKNRAKAFHNCFVVGLAIVFVAYHMFHPSKRYNMCFKDLEKVTPYHAQISILIFPPLLWISFVMYVQDVFDKHSRKEERSRDT